MTSVAQAAGNLDLLDLHRRHAAMFPFLLESVASGTGARWDILFAMPGECLRGESGLAQLAERLANSPAVDNPGQLPFLGGWFLLLGYEAARYVEPTLQLPPSPHRLPDFLAVHCAGAVIRDHATGRTLVVGDVGQDWLDHFKKLPETPDKKDSSISNPLAIGIAEDDPARFLDGVDRILEYLRQGDVFQVNLSRRWQAHLAPETHYTDVYRSLRRHNPAPFAGLALVDGIAVLSSSPERLVSGQGREVLTSPIAGTRPRGTAGVDDERLSAQLIGSLKERAEHVMLIDLERNDLGRVCEPGSVGVSELMRVESYAHVHHIVSDVRGRLRPDAGPVDLLRAVFPGGTITGCPKVRAMEIIAELEGVGRGPYTGSMGYLSACGRFDTNILIRSLVVEDGVASFRAGAGIVADSVPEAELAETRAKARGMLLALGALP